MDGKIAETKNLYLWSISSIYFFAFASLYSQIPGLYGEKGILPAKLVLNQEGRSLGYKFQEKPTLLWLLQEMGMTVSHGMELLCIMGCVLSLICILSRKMRDCFMFITLWFLYLSVYQVGQTFLWFQWDILLLEAGFLTILVAPFHLKKWENSTPKQHDTIMLWLVRWLLFRLMFASGVVKLTSRCPTWWGLTALNYHYETQCISTPLAWYAHQLPEWFQKLSVAATFVIEIVLPFLFFAPIRNLKMFAFWSQILLQVLIILTGNYNFFNLLTIALCISLLDDSFFSKTSQNTSKGKLRANLERLISIVTYCLLAYWSVRYFTLRWDSKTLTVTSKIAFTEADFFSWVTMIMPVTVWLGSLSLLAVIISALCRCLTVEKGVFQKIASLFQCLFVAGIAIYMFSISLVPHSVVDQQAYRNIPPVIRKWHEKTDFLQITHSYGLFRRMTGVGGRPEVIIEGSRYLEKGWKPYEFYYKPGNISSIPAVCTPHQPRLDWQMWFAALGRYEHNPWFINLVYRLLTNEPTVLDLIAHNPFQDKPPRYIRAKLYHYHFTQWGKSSKSWWKRKEVQEYLPPLEKNNPSLVEFLKQNGILEKKKLKKETNPTILTSFVIFLRGYLGQLTGPVIIYSLYIPTLFVSFFKGL